MKFLRLKNISGKDIIVNLSNVTYFFGGSSTTTINFTTPDDYITVNTSIDEFEEMLQNEFEKEKIFKNMNLTTD